jgi:hypothetical protein
VAASQVRALSIRCRIAAGTVGFGSGCLAIQASSSAYFAGGIRTRTCIALLNFRPWLLHTSTLPSGPFGCYQVAIGLARAPMLSGAAKWWNT